MCVVAVLPALADTSTLTFTAACGGTGTAGDGVVWTVTSDGIESTYDATKGIHYGTGSSAVQYLQLSTSGISGTITKVVVNASTASGVSATVSVTIGGNAFGGNPQLLSSTATNYTFTGSASGQIVVRVEKPESAVKALYVKSIAVTYTPTPSLTEVTGIDGLKSVDTGTNVRLFLPDANNARVLYVKNNGSTVDAYVRDDNGGAVLMQGITPNRPMAYNQHLAGWIDGTYNINSDGMPLFVPNSDTNTAFLVIADRVTEEPMLPDEVAIGEIGDNLANWVTIQDLGSDDVNLQNTLSNFTAPYAGALYDVSAIAAKNNTLYPITQNGIPAITYVIDSERNFTSPSQEIEDVAVRVKRSLRAGQWAMLTLPFDYYEFDGIVQEYNSLTRGADIVGTVSGQTFAAGQMNFTKTTMMQAGVPYIVKPNDDYDEFVATDVILSNAAASSVTHNIGGANYAPSRSSSTTITSDDDYTLVGVYSPTQLPADNKYKAFDANGDVVRLGDNGSTTVPGTSAYIVSPANQGLHLSMSGSGIVTGVSEISITEQPVQRGIYNMMGVRMPDNWDQLPPGFYIVNGVKTIKR